MDSLRRSAPRPAGPDSDGLRPWLVEFTESRVEDDFRRRGLERRAVTLQRAMYVASVAVVIVTGPRLVATGVSVSSLVVSLSSLALAVAGTIFGGRVGRNHELALRFGLVSALGAWGIVMVIAGPLFTSAPAAACELVLVGLMFGEFLYLPNRLAYTTVINAIGVAAYLILSWTVFPHDQFVDAQSALVIVVLLVIARMTAAETERTRRQQHVTSVNEQRTIARLSSEIVTRQQVEAELSWLADHDALTDLLTRRAFFEQAEQLVTRARRGGHPVSVLVVDADHFKAVNDAYGHHTGDEVIRIIARTCKAAVRATDVVGRLGGEEFAVVMSGVDLAMAVDLAEGLCSRIREIAVEHPFGNVDVTVSIGAAQCQLWTETIDEALQRADAAMYVAKEAGRDRTAVSSTEAA